MADLSALNDLQHNRGKIADPAQYARDANAASWLYLCGEAFASMDGGMSYADVQAAVDTSANVVSDPPVVMDMDLARQQIAALDKLPQDQREALILVGASGFSYEDAAAICGCAVGTIKSRVNRARSKLSNLLYVDGADDFGPDNTIRAVIGGGGG